jgi:hypothetical protein
MPCAGCKIHIFSLSSPPSLSALSNLKRAADSVRERIVDENTGRLMESRRRHPIARLQGRKWRRKGRFALAVGAQIIAKICKKALDCLQRIGVNTRCQLKKTEVKHAQYEKMASSSCDAGGGIKSSANVFH